MDSQNADTTLQVTSAIPVTKLKNPKRVAAGKAIAEKRRQALEAQKQKMVDAETIIAREQLKKAEEAKEAARPAGAPATAVAEAPEPQAADSRTLTTTQWLSVISIIISVVGVYYKREEIKKVFAKPKKVSTPPTPPEVVKTPKKGSLRPMD